MPRLSRNLIRSFRATVKRWSSQKDKNYHDVVFAHQDYDPFCASYPGNITIRRFADLAAPYLIDSITVLDLGCGTGEITSELARRFPGISFSGVDHSEKGIDRAKSNARSLGLKNTTFITEDMEVYLPDSEVDIVLMFDSFHHLTDPRRLVERFGEYTNRFLLIEPRGNWKGGWQKDLDFDWLILELEKIRARTAYFSGENEPELKRPTEKRQARPESPIEHRYTRDDFEAFFSGHGLSIRGTVSGLDAYPPDALSRSPSREYFGRLAYDLYKEIDDRLYERNLDLLSKHWVIYAERGAGSVNRELPAKLPDRFGDVQAKGAYDVEYVRYSGSRTAKAKDIINAEVRLRNRSFRVWSSAESERPDYLSYHWLDKRGSVIVSDGERSPLPRPIGPDEECDVTLRVRMPDKPGRYTLAVDLVREHTTWFSDAGSPWLRILFRVR